MTNLRLSWILSRDSSKKSKKSWWTSILKTHLRKERWMKHLPKYIIISKKLNNFRVKYSWRQSRFSIWSKLSTLMRIETSRILRLRSKRKSLISKNCKGSLSLNEIIQVFSSLRRMTAWKRISNQLKRICLA